MSNKCPNCGRKMRLGTYIMGPANKEVELLKCSCNLMTYWPTEPVQEVINDTKPDELYKKD